MGRKFVYDPLPSVIPFKEPFAAGVKETKVAGHRAATPVGAMTSPHPRRVCLCNTSHVLVGHPCRLERRWEDGTQPRRYHGAVMHVEQPDVAVVDDC